MLNHNQNYGDVMVVGQEKLCSKIDTLNIDTIPRTILLLGEYGSGKHTVTKYIGKRFNFEVEDISDNLTLELIDDITNRVSPKIYLIDSSKLTIKNENVILKFLEEPLKNAIIVVIATNKQSIIPTVLNRCQVWELDTYNNALLSSFVTDKTIDTTILMRVANTPGKVIEYQSYPLDSMVNLAYKIFGNMKNANFANVLTLSRFIAFKNEKDKFDFDLFLDILLMVSNELYINGTLNKTEIYELTNKLNNSKYIFNIDKKSLFEHYLIELKLLMSK